MRPLFLIMIMLPYDKASSQKKGEKEAKKPSKKGRKDSAHFTKLFYNCKKVTIVPHQCYFIRRICTIRVFAEKVYFGLVILSFLQIYKLPNVYRICSWFIDQHLFLKLTRKGEEKVREIKRLDVNTTNLFFLRR